MPSPSGSGTAKSGYARQSEVSVLSLANKQHKSTHIVFNAVIGCNWDRFGSAKSAQSSDEESTLANNRFTKANEYHVVPPPITGNPLTPRADISFAGLDEYAFRNKIIESKTTETNKTVGTDKAKITRKRSKPDKHGHGKRRAQKEPEMDVESAFLYGTIEEDVHQPPGFVDPAHPNKVYKARHHMFNVLCRNFTNVQDSGLCRSQFDRKSTTGGCQFLGMKTHILGIVQYKKLGQIMQISLLLRQNMLRSIKQRDPTSGIRGSGEEDWEDDWDASRAKLEANAELTKDVLGKDLPEEDFAKGMAEMVNQRKKHFAEERAKAKRNKPMTQSQLRIYMSNYLKNQGTWKLSQLKKLKFEEIKEEFDKLVQQIDTFVPINLEATKAKLKRYGEELQTKTSKKQRFDDKDVPAIGEKVAEVKEEEPVKRTGKRKKQKARKGINVDKSAQEDSETDKEESVEAMNPTPLTTKSDSVVNWKIFQQGQRSIYQIMRANGADTVYMSFGAMIKDFTREDLIELYRLVMQKYGTNRPEDAYDRVLWSDLRTMFDPPLNEDAIWSLPLQQKMVSWRYYDKCEVHCLTLEACTIYMLADRKYPLSKEACQVMLKMKLLDGKMNEVCYKLLKMIEKQAGIRK
ncbi:hypothetical protein Tco_0269591 [Tanacetum coccineum]